MSVNKIEEWKRGKHQEKEVETKEVRENITEQGKTGKRKGKIRMEEWKRIKTQRKEREETGRHRERGKREAKRE